MTVFTQRPDSTTGYDTYLKSTANKASETRLSIGRTYTPAETVVTREITGYTTMAKLFDREIAKYLYVTYTSWLVYYKDKKLSSNNEIARFKLISTYQEHIYRDWETDRKSTRLNSSHSAKSRMPSSA